MSESRGWQHIVGVLNGYEPEIGRWLWAMEDTRRRTKRALEGVDDEVLTWIAPHIGNSIGTLLYHIAAIEMDWLYADVLEKDFPSELEPLLAYDVRDDQGKLTVVSQESLDQHLQRLDVTRQYFLTGFERMTMEEFRRPRRFTEYDVTPEWVIHHLIQHEAEHRGQIGELRVIAEQALRDQPAG